MKRQLAALLAASAVYAAPMAHADTWTVDGIDYPQCFMEDGSDSAILPCVWIDPDSGQNWLTFSDRSIRITP